MRKLQTSDIAIKLVSFTVAGIITLGSAAILAPSASAQLSSVQDESKKNVDRFTTPDDGKTSKISYDDLPGIIQRILSPDDAVVKKMQVKGGLTAWIIHSTERPAEAAVLYTTQDDEALIHGRLFGVSGEGITEYSEQYAQRYAPVIDLQSQWDNITKSHWLADGASDDKATRVVYGFFDANCIYCHLAWLALEPYMEKGLQIRWMPVAVIGESSGRKAAALYAAENTATAMRNGHMNWDNGGFPQAEDVPADILTNLDENLNLMRSLGASGTPAFFYKDDQDQVKAVHGMPNLSKAAEMAGMDQIKNNDPRLERFN